MLWNKKEIYLALDQKVNHLLDAELSSFERQKKDAWITEELDIVLQEGEELLKTEIPMLTYSLFKLYWITGNRSQYEARYFDHRKRLLTFALLCRFFPEDLRWKEALEDSIWAICEEAFWTIPASFLEPPDDKALKFQDYMGTIDLFAAETAFGLAETLEMCRDQLDENVVCRAEMEVERRIFSVFSTDRMHRFELQKNNWSAVCAGALGGAAIHMVHDRSRLAAILHRCLSAIEVYLSSFGEDGVSEEGLTYWTYGFGFLTCFADLLKKRTDGRLDLFSLPIVHAIAACQGKYYLSGNQVVSFSDSRCTGTFRMGISCLLQKIYPDATLPDRQYAAHILTDDKCYRFCLALRDFLWYDSHAVFGIPEERGYYLPDVQWFVSGGRHLVLAAKAGKNFGGHNHNDVSSFIFCKDGEALLVDPGAGEYTADYFGPRRYTLFHTSSRGHSVPVIGGKLQDFGAECSAENVQAVLGKEQDTFSMEATKCYRHPALLSYCRHFLSDRREETVTIRDRFRFSEPESVTESFVSFAPICIKDGKAYFSGNKAQAVMEFDPALKAEILTEQWTRFNAAAHRTNTFTAYLLQLTSPAAETYDVTMVIR